MSLEGLDALAALGLDTSAVVEASVIELPHLDGLVKRTRDEMATIRRERDTVDAILVALFAFSALNKNTSLGIPDADALVQATRSDEAVVGRDGNSGNAILDLKSENALVLLDVPKSDCAVAGTRGDVTSVGSEVERVDVLLMTRELV